MFDYDDSYDNEFYTYNWPPVGKPEYSFWLCDSGVAIPDVYDDSYLDRADFVRALKAARAEQRRIFAINDRSTMFDHYELRPFKFQLEWQVTHSDMRGITMVITESPQKKGDEVVRRELINADDARDYVREQSVPLLPLQSSIAPPGVSVPRKTPNSSGYVYLIKASTGQYKIGSTSSLDERIAMIARNLPPSLVAVLPDEPLVLTYVHRIYTSDRWTFENVLRKRYIAKRIHRTKDWFNLDESDVAEICAISDE